MRFEQAGSAMYSGPSSGSDSGPGRSGIAADLRPHAYDPASNPELFEGVLTRRVAAFIIDVIIIAVPLIGASIFIFVLGIVTLGLGWALFWLLSPASVIWALLYYGMTLGSPASATFGMRVMDIVLGAVHAIVFWISVSVLTPLILVVGFFNPRKRLLHDILVGAVLINNTGRTASLQGRTAGYGGFGV
jgi:uncharacterized RDD family membrane protein YckC